MPQTSTGRKLRVRGFEGSKADWVAHVCFDSYAFKDLHITAPCVFIYSPKTAAKLAASKPGVSGSRAGATEKGTGFGAKISPAELGAWGVEFIPEPSMKDAPLGLRGEVEVRRLLEERGWKVQKADRNEQMDGIDLIATRGDKTIRYEVKSRGEDKAYPDLFIQTHEANPDKRIS